MRQTKLLIALVLSLCVNTAVCLADDSKSHHHHHSHYSHGIRNLREVHPWLFRGGEPPPESIKTLYEMGVTTIVDLRNGSGDADEELALCKKFGIKLVRIPLTHRRQPTKAQTAQFLQIVDTARQHTGKGSVFVHCQMGDDRTGCMVAMSRIAFDNYTFQEAYEEMLHYGFNRHFEKLVDAVKEFAEQNNKVTSK